MHTETRPWGIYEVLHIDKDVWLKRLIIAPGQSLSLQSHKERDEYWYPLSNIKVTIEGSTWTAMKNEVVIVYANEQHRITNTSDQEVVVIEWAVGRPVESDIIRHEDNYGRA